MFYGIICAHWKMIGVLDMNQLERTKYRKAIKRYEKLGAARFQKVVFAVERLKYKAIKTFCPNFIMHYDRICDRKKKRLLKKAKTEQERKQIIQDIRFEKMAMRKELNQEQNRNYHMSKKNPTEIYPYLEWNKKVHKNGLIKNGVLIPFLLAGSIAHIPGCLPLLIWECISAGINFECINIQNYSMARYKLVEERLKRQEERRRQEAIKEYHEASTVIGKQIEKKEELPSFREIIDSVETREQIRQLKKLLLIETQDRGLELVGGNEKCV